MGMKSAGEWITLKELSTVSTVVSEPIDVSMYGDWAIQVETAGMNNAADSVVFEIWGYQVNDLSADAGWKILQHAPVNAAGAANIGAAGVVTLTNSNTTSTYRFVRPFPIPTPTNTYEWALVRYVRIKVTTITQNTAPAWTFKYRLMAGNE